MTEQHAPVVVTATTGAWTLPEVATCSMGFSTCEGIGTLQVDPHDFDVNNHKIMRYLCPSCYENRLYGF